jgi:hypothetical protein
MTAAKQEGTFIPVDTVGPIGCCKGWLRLGLEVGAG